MRTDYILLGMLLLFAVPCTARTTDILITPTFTDILTVGKQSIDTKRLLIPSLIYQLFIKADPHQKQKAYVRAFGTTPKISTDECTYLKARDQVCNAQVSQLLGRPVALKHTPRIAFLGSGGGMRAGLFTAGNLKTFAESKLINTFGFTGGVSGSTWTITPWQLSGKPFEQFYPTHINRIVHGLIPQTLNQGSTNFLCFTDTISETFLRTLAFLDVPSSIDLYGLFLGLGLLGDGTKASYHTTTLSSIVPFIKNGQQPLMLCTAVIPSATKPVIDFDVVETTPYDITDYSSNTSVPAWAGGRTFKNGVSTNAHPPLPIGYLMGIYGSSHTAVTLKAIWPMVLEKLWPKEFFMGFNDLFNETCIGGLRLFPAHVRNFSYGMAGATHQSDLFNLWVDAGVSINIPIVPFFKQPDRAIDIYVICDAGGDVAWSNVISESEQYARAGNYQFPHCDSYYARSNTLSVFDDGAQANQPIVIYLPMIKNTRYNNQFDPQDMMYNNTPGNFLQSGNFTFTQAQADLLAGLGAFQATEAEASLLDAIKKVVERKEQGLRPPIVYPA